MSSMTLSPSVARGVRLGNRAHFALLGLATVLAAAIANALVFYVADPFVAYDQRFQILNSAAPAISMTVMCAVPAVLLYAALLRYSSNPARHFSIVSAVVFVIALVPDFTIAPSTDGSSSAQIAVLILMHVVAASVIVGMLTKLARPTER
jgi:FlaA1/EpsC-like NDP-sugar epimerase